MGGMHDRLFARLVEGQHLGSGEHPSTMGAGDFHRAITAFHIQHHNVSEAILDRFHEDAQVSFLVARVDDDRGLKHVFSSKQNETGA